MTKFTFTRMKECQSRLVWLSKDGRETPVESLAQSHLENILVFLDKKLNSARLTLEEIDKQRDGLVEDEDSLVDVEILDQIEHVIHVWTLWIPIINAEIERRRRATESSQHS